MVPALKGLTLVSSSKNAGYALSSKYYPLLKQLLLPHTAGVGIGVKGLEPRQVRGKHSRRLVLLRCCQHPHSPSSPIPPPPLPASLLSPPPPFPPSPVHPALFPEGNPGGRSVPRSLVLGAASIRSPRPLHFPLLCPLPQHPLPEEHVSGLNWGGQGGEDL